MNLIAWKDAILNHQLDDQLKLACGLGEKDTLDASQYDRYIKALEEFKTVYGDPDEVFLFSAPGRTELLGNHTDHQLGQVLAGSVNVDVLAIAAYREDQMISFQSQGWDRIEMSLDCLEPDESEYGTTLSLIRGVAASVCELGAKPKGLNIYCTSDVLPGSGLSSSAAIEVMLAMIMCKLWDQADVTPVKWAMMSQRAENVFFGKPSGLMDQMASAVGSAVHIDFYDQEHPVIEPLALELNEAGYALCILNSGADHADLTDEYAAIPSEMKSVAEALGATHLSHVDAAKFYEALPHIRQAVGDRAILRAHHLLTENERVKAACDAIRAHDFDGFLEQIKSSGQSSWMYLQNISPLGAESHQEMAIALLACEHALAGKGAYRVHGGGFAGTVQAFVPLAELSAFKAQTEAVLGDGACQVLTVRRVGAFQYKV